MPNLPFPKDVFSDALAANTQYASNFTSEHLTGTAAKGLAILETIEKSADEKSWLDC
jgi:hypothetical protein